MEFIDLRLPISYFQKSFWGHHWSVNTYLGVYVNDLLLIKLDVDMFIYTLYENFNAIFSLIEWGVAMDHAIFLNHLSKVGLAMYTGILSPTTILTLTSFPDNLSF